jgi:hypothetical protein
MKITVTELIARHGSGERDFTGVDFVEDEACLRDADLSGSNFTGANLSWAQMSNVNFTGANFTGANLSWAQMSDVNFTNTNFTGANLSWVKLSYVDLTDVDLTGVTWGSLKEDLNLYTTLGRTQLGTEKHVRTPEFCDSKTQQWAEGMLAKLKAGTAKGRPDWCSKTETSVEALVLHLFAEIHELLASSTLEERMREAADVANVVHMLAEHIGDDPATASRALAAAKMVRQTYSG